MFTIGNLIVRLVPILFGLVLAYLAAGVFIGLGFYTQVLDPAFGIEPEMRENGFLVFVMGMVWSPFIATAAFVPSLFVIALAEMLKLRSLIANALGGGLVALFVYWVQADNGPFEGLTEGPITIALAAGFIGGAVYWLAAGRKAGKWLEMPGSV